MERGEEDDDDDGVAAFWFLIAKCLVHCIACDPIYHTPTYKRPLYLPV